MLWNGCREIQWKCYFFLQGTFYSFSSCATRIQLLLDFRLSSNFTTVRELCCFSSGFSYIEVVHLCSIALLELYSWLLPLNYLQVTEKCVTPHGQRICPFFSPFQSAHTSWALLLVEWYCAIQPLSYLCLYWPILHLLLLSQAFIKVVPAMSPKHKRLNIYEECLIKD